MPVYQLSPFQRAVQQATPGVPAYMLGSLNRIVAPTRIAISTVACNGATGTIVGTVVEGQIPTAGQLVSIQGAVPAYFNVTNVKIASVSAAATPDIGVYTITFSLVNTFQATVASSGVALAPQIEIGDAIGLGNASGGTWNSAAIALQSNTGAPSQGRTIRFDVNFPVLPGACTIVAQTADVDIDTDYVDAGTVASVTGGVQTGASLEFVGVLQNFARLSVRAIAAPGSATIVGRLLA